MLSIDQIENAVKANEYTMLLLVDGETKIALSRALLNTISYKKYRNTVTNGQLSIFASARPCSYQEYLNHKTANRDLFPINEK